MARETPTNGKTVFLVEDDEDLRSHTQSALIEAGYHVLSTSSVPDARFKIKNQKFDLLLLDFRLKGMTAEEILQAVRANKKEPNFATPILMISANLDLEIIKRIRTQISGALVKPFGVAELLTRVGNLLGLDTSMYQSSSGDDDGLSSNAEEEF